MSEPPKKHGWEDQSGSSLTVEGLGRCGGGTGTIECASPRRERNPSRRRLKSPLEKSPRLAASLDDWHWHVWLWLCDIMVIRLKSLKKSLSVMTQRNRNVREKAWADSKKTATQVAVVCGVLSNICIDYAPCASSTISNERNKQIWMAPSWMEIVLHENITHKGMEINSMKIFLFSNPF